MDGSGGEMILDHYDDDDDVVVSLFPERTCHVYHAPIDVNLYIGQLTVNDNEIGVEQCVTTPYVRLPFTYIIINLFNFFFI